MDIEFHYHVTALVARHPGFGEADAAVIGHGAQLVDDNHVPRMVVDPAARPVFRSLPTQARGRFGPWTLMRAVYPVFHFVPRRPRGMSPRADGAAHPLVTTPDAPGARALLAAAFHADADTRKAHDRGARGLPWEALAGPLSEVLRPEGAARGRSARMAAYGRLAPGRRSRARSWPTCWPPPATTRARRTRPTWRRRPWPGWRPTPDAPDAPRARLLRAGAGPPRRSTGRGPRRGSGPGR